MCLFDFSYKKKITNQVKNNDWPQFAYGPAGVPTLINCMLQFGGEHTQEEYFLVFKIHKNINLVHPLLITETFYSKLNRF